MDEAPKKKTMTAVTYPKRLTHYDNESGMAALHELARRDRRTATAYLRELVRTEAKKAGISITDDPA